MRRPSCPRRGPVRRFPGVLSPLLVAAALAVAACDGGPALGPIEGLPRELTTAENQLIQSDNTFALEIFREVRGAHPGDDVFLSPLSMAMALGMTYNGANGQTQTQMADALALDGMRLDDVNRSYRSLIDLLLALDPRVDLTLANSIWARQGVQFEAAFLDVNRQYFDAQVEALDFSQANASDIINGWVADATGGRIERIVPESIPSDVVMYLINAIHFKATWAQQFDKDETRDRPFRLHDGTEVSVPTMTHGQARDFGSYTDDMVTVVDLPYGGGAFSMTVILPAPGVTVAEVAASLDDATWGRWIAGLTERAVIVQLPKFTIEFEETLNDALSALGMVDAFVPRVADFTKMSARGDLYITTVKHKAFVDVDEEGTEAAAATSVEVGVVCACGPPVIAVDRPFVFAIRERFSGALLFMGQVMDPR